MRFPALLLATIALTSPLKASKSSCHENCYAKKVACNKNHGHTFNSCSDELFTCKANCRSETNHKAFNFDRIPYELAPHLL